MGFNMAAHDVGLEQSFDQTEKSLKSINGMVEGQNKLAKKTEKEGLWAKMKSGVKDFNVASIAKNVRKLTGETGTLTSELEGMAVANAQAVKPIIAQLDLSASAAKKMVSRVSGMAIGMNVGATEVADVFKSIQQAGGPAKSVLDELNLSEKDWVKITTTSGISMAEMTGVMGDLAGEWGVAPKKAAGLLNSLVEIGKKTGTGIHALKTATAVVDEFGQTQFGLAKHLRLSGDEIANATMQAYKLSGAFREMGANEEQAVTLGKDTAKMFMEQSAAYKSARAMGESLPEDNLLVQLRAMGVDETRALEIMAVGERDAVAGMQILNEEVLKAAGSTEMHKVMLGRLAKSLGQTGQSLVWLAESSTVGTKALADMSKMALDGKSNLKSFGDQAFSSGRTLQQSFELAQQSFDQQIRNIARGNVVKLVQKQMQGYKRMGKQVRELGSDETWGPLMNAFSTFKQMGVRGLGLAFLDKNASKETVNNAIDMGIAFETAFDTLQLVGDELAPLNEILGMFGPLGPLAAMGGVAAMFMMDEADAKGILGGFYDTFKGIKDMVMKVWDMIPWESMWEKFNKVGSKIWTTIVEDIPWRAMLDNAMPVLKDIAAALFDALWEAGKTFASHLSGGTLALGGAFAAAMIGGQTFGPFGALIGLGIGAAAALMTGIEAEYDATAKKLDAKEKQRKADKKARAAEGTPIVVQEEMQRELTAGAQILAGREGEPSKRQKGFFKRKAKKLGEGSTWVDAWKIDLEERAAAFIEWDDAFKREVEAKAFASSEATRMSEGAGLTASMSWEDPTKGGEVKKGWEEMMKSAWVAGAYIDKETEAMRDGYERRKLALHKESQKGILGLGWYTGGFAFEKLAEQQEDAQQTLLEMQTKYVKTTLAGKGVLLPEQEDLIANMKKIAYLTDVQTKMDQNWNEWAAQGPAVLVDEMNKLVDTYLPQAEQEAFQNWLAAIRDPVTDVVVLTDKELDDAFLRWGDTLDAEGQRMLGIVDMIRVDPEVVASWDAADKAIQKVRDSVVDLTSADEEWMDANKDWIGFEEEGFDQTVQTPEQAAAAPQSGPGAALTQAVNNFEVTADSVTNRVMDRVKEWGNQIGNESQAAALKAALGGEDVATEWGVGFSTGAVGIGDAVDEAMLIQQKKLGGSLPEDGPLGGVAGSNPAYFGGRSVAEEWARGFVSAEEETSKWITDSMQRLVDTIFTSYEDEMAAQMNKSNSLSQMADKVIQQFGATVTMGKLEGDADLNLKSGKDLFKVALDKPGLVSVVTAIITSGQETQKVLIAIKKNTDELLDRPIMSKTLQFKAGTMTVAG